MTRWGAQVVVLLATALAACSGETAGSGAGDAGRVEMRDGSTLDAGTDVRGARSKRHAPRRSVCSVTTPKPREACPSAADGTETASASVLLRRSLEMLDSVGQLLQALSPAEIEAVAERARLGRLVDRDAIYWRLYSDRHRVLSDVFATQRSTFTQAAQACLGRDHRPAAERS